MTRDDILAALHDWQGSAMLRTVWSHLPQDARDRYEREWGPRLDDVLYVLRSRIPGFDALLGGSAVVVPRVQDLEMRVAGISGCETHCWKRMLAASPFAGEKP